MAANWVLSVDFGTTTTAAAISDGDRVELVEVDGAPRIPSVVLAADSGDLVVGAAAERQLALTPERAERTPKRRIGDATMLLGHRAVRPVEAVAAIFQAIAAEAVRRQGGMAPGTLRLTHPARWGAVRLAVLAEAAALAELPVPSFIPEPVAAAVHFADEHIVDGAHVAVYDLGGGTFDTAVLRRVGRGFEVIGAPGGDERLGGETFDERLWEHLGARVAERHPDAWEELRFGTERQWRKAGHDFRIEVKRAKEALSTNADFTIYLGAPVDVELLITRDELEELIRGDVERTVGELLATVDRAGLALSDLAAVNLVGGSSRIPLITRLVADRIGRLPETWGDPKAAVVLGAAKAAPESIKSSDPGRRRDRKATPPLVTIDGYDVLGELGRGGMGVVYLARQPSLGRLVAVKTLPSLDTSLTSRLEREANVLAELQHPHIATVVDVGVQGAATFVVMPFFPGGTLTQVLDERGALTPGQVAGVLAAVAEALAATHAKGFLHRDVKPSNILLSADGQPYLADFGLAFPMLDGSRLTSSRSVLGTVPYTAPEIIADEPPQPASDVYALGVTGYQLLTGKLPYGGSNVIAIIDAIRRGAAAPIGDAAPEASPELAELIMSAMAADPMDRPADLRHFAAALRRAANVEDVTPAPPAAWAALATAPVSDPVAEPSIGTAAEGRTPAEVGAEGPAGRDAGDLAELQSTPRLPRKRLVVAIAAAVLLIAGIAAGAMATSREPSTEVATNIRDSSSTSSTTSSTETTISTTTTDTAVPEPTDTTPETITIEKPIVKKPTTVAEPVKPADPVVVARDPDPPAPEEAPAVSESVATAPGETSEDTGVSSDDTSGGTSGGGTTGSSTTTTVTQPEPANTYPNAAEQSLLAEIPSSVKGDGSSCARSANILSGATASIICGIAYADYVQYNLFASNAEVESYYAGRQTWARNNYPGEMTGGCDGGNGDYSGESPYWQNDAFGDQVYVGRLLCYWHTGTNRQWYEWRYDEVPIYAFIRAGSPSGGWDAWIHAGPYLA